QTNNNSKSAKVKITPADKQKQDKTSSNKKENTNETTKPNSISKEQFDSLSQQLKTTISSLDEANKKIQNLQALQDKSDIEFTDLNKKLRAAEDNIIDPMWLIAAGVLGLVFGFLVGKVLTKPQTVEKVTEKIIEKPAAFTAQEKEQWQTQVANLEKDKDELLKKVAKLETELALVQKEQTPTIIATHDIKTPTDTPITQDNSPATPLLRYANSAVNKGEGFELRDLREQLRYEYFALELNEAEGTGTFYVVDSPETQEAAIQNFDTILATTCEYSELPNGRKKIVVLEAGRLQKDNQFWRIMQKVRIRFE
ncbi:MAG: hypothetical protein ACOVQA_03520, partial [Thermoflexibacteraceae bacterium]